MRILEQSLLQIKYKRIFFICLFLFLSNGLVFASVTDGQDRDTHAKQDSLCRELKQIHRIPFNDEPVNDVTYNKVAQAGSTIVPCLLSRIIDTTKMHDPRSEPTFSDFRVGDLAFFLLIQLQNVPFEIMLPSEVQARLKTEGVYAYFRYVRHFKNRQTLQRRVREWLVLSGHAIAGTAKEPLSQVCIDSRTFESSRVRLAIFNVNNVGETMLLFCSDANGKIQSLFVSPQFIDIQENDLDNAVTFNSGLFADDRFYSFKGHSSGQALVGQLELKTKSGDTVFTAPVTIKTLGDLLDSKNNATRLRHYSNAEFIQDSGDVIGAEVWIASTGKDMAGFVIFYESYWGEPVQIPLAMKRVGKMGTTITFDLQIPATRGYKLVLSPKQAKLFRLGEEKPSEGVVLAASPLLGRYPIR